MNVIETMNKLMILCDDCQCMTEWEYEFVDQMEGKRMNDESFTIPQLEQIEKIYEDRMT